MPNYIEINDTVTARRFVGDVRYTVVSKNYEYRPDLLSYEAYGLSEFWWQILEFNEIKDVYDFKAGLNITIPQNFFR